MKRGFLKRKGRCALIDKDAFAYCSGLESVTILNSVTSIAFSVFGDRVGLESVIFEDKSGWAVDGTNISADDRFDSAKAAEYLTEAYCWNVWTKTQ